MVCFDTVSIYSDPVSGSPNRTYTENSLHRPQPFGNTVGALANSPEAVWYKVAPRDLDLFSYMELPTPDTSTGNPVNPVTAKSYSFIKCDLAAEDKLWGIEHIYGWIDEVKLRVSRGDKSSVGIRWHVDWYHTLGEFATFGCGRILRGPQSFARPDTSAPRRWVYDSKKDLIPSRTSRYVIVEYIKKLPSSDPDEPYNQIVLAWWQIGETISIQGVGNLPTVSMDGIYAGEIEESLGLDPDVIVGAWLSPFQPFSAVHATRYNANVAWRESYATQYNKGNVDMGTFVCTTDDSSKCVLLDPYGSPAWVVPWGYTFASVDWIIDIGTAGASVIYRFKEASGTHYNEGCIVSVPMISIPITSNSMASYVYSGQREYDIRMREIQKNQAAINGIAGVGTSAIGGAVAGSMAAGPAGTAAGAIAGIVSSTIGTAVSYVSAGHFDRKTQEAVDKLTANQADAPIITAGGPGGFMDYTVNPGDCIVKMVRDSVSLAELTAEQSELGYLTDCWSTDCDSLLWTPSLSLASGGWRISGLEVLGLHREARDYIAAIFERGVHID